MKTWWNWLAFDDSARSEFPLQAADTESEPVALVGIRPSGLNTSRLIGLFIWLGLLARVIRFYLCFPLWDDESFLCVNLIDRTYAELLQPLDYHQVAPILFLWMERAFVQLLGFSEYALRLCPFLCSIASLFVFRRVAERLLTGSAVVLAVAIFAVSYPGIRYAAEAKPYGTDMFISLVMLWTVVEWKQRRDARMLVPLALFMPLALGISYPAVFAAGGLSLVVGGILLGQRGTRREWSVWCFWNVALVASFACWFLMAGRVQGGAEGEFMGEYWKQSFPPVSQPWLLPYWLLKTHASDFLAYPVGGPKWASTGTMMFCVVGLWQLARQRQFFCLGLLLGPVSLHFIAAALQKYPYGGHVKFSQYLAPMICCLAAVGLAQLLQWWSTRGPSAKTVLAWGCAACIAIGCGAIARDLTNPYKTRSDFRARAFAESFWTGAHSAEEVTCLNTESEFDFVPEQRRELSWSAHFLCNHAIEVSRSRLRPANLDLVTDSRPLRCVLYRDARYALDQQRLDQWLADMQQKYDLVAHESLPFPRKAKDDRKLVTMEYVDSYKFVPRGSMVAALPSTADDRKSEQR